MNSQEDRTVATSNDEFEFVSAVPDTAWPWSRGKADKALAAALSRLAASSRRCQRRKGEFNGPYYGTSYNPEEIIASTDVSHAVITRNHYGSLIVNASRALFIDIDVAPIGRISRWMNSFRGRYRGRWHKMLEDLRTVLSSERDEGFRIYRTAAGFRVLATTSEFEPGSPRSERLMHAVGADPTFVNLCQLQGSFRARLTPKPWRCDATKPPNAFPRKSASDQERFAEWLADYQCACQNRATCRYLGCVGSERVHERVALVVELHDRETKAFESLPLA